MKDVRVIRNARNGVEPNFHEHSSGLANVPKHGRLGVEPNPEQVFDFLRIADPEPDDPRQDAQPVAFEELNGAPARRYLATFRLSHGQRAEGFLDTGRDTGAGQTGLRGARWQQASDSDATRGHCNRRSGPCAVRCPDGAFGYFKHDLVTGHQRHPSTHRAHSRASIMREHWCLYRSA